MITPLKVTPAEREAEGEAIRNFLTGATPAIPFVNEGDWESEAEALVTAGSRAIEQNAANLPGWARYTWGKALLRGVPYARASRGRMLALGAQNAFRELYEGARQAADAKVR